MTNKSLKLNEPFLLIPAGIEKLWGGTRLRDDFSKSSKTDYLAETWECSTHPSGISIIANGKFKGQKLSNLIVEHPEILGSNLEGQNTLPVMLKLIDANKDLSIQVHPNEEYAQSHENGEHGKAEMWYVLDAYKDSKLIYGLAHNLTKDELRQAIENNNIENYLQKIPVKKGDIFYIKPGIIHAIGSGVLLAEIQQSSNLTYRLYDYNRLDFNGQKRELHINKALDVAKLTTETEPRQPMRVLKFRKGGASELLCRCQFFQVERLLINTERTKELYKTKSNKQSFIILLCVNGCGIICYEAEHYFPVFKGDCVFVPANSVELKIHGFLELLQITC